MDWTATHEVPSDGTRAWQEPHPEAQELDRIAGDSRVLIIEERGAWALVETADGIRAWVDGRRLTQIETPAGTHRVPEDGTRAWAEPHPEATELDRIGGNTEVRVLEERGAWAQVRTADGTTAWVDGRRLERLAVPSPIAHEPTVAATADRVDTEPLAVVRAEVPAADRPLAAWSWLSLAGAALVVAATGTPWFRPVLGNLDGWDLPLAFTVDRDAGQSEVSIAVGLLVVTIGGLLLASRVHRAWRQVAGAVIVLLALAVVWQLLGFAAELGDGGRFDVLDDVVKDGLHAGPYVAILGGLALLSGR